MSDTIIQVDNLGKKYIISHQQKQPYSALRDVITNGVKSLRRNLIDGRSEKSKNLSREEFWALKDVSFEIKRGDRVGIIGRNGAGKSTLLKVLSRITEPTTGKIKIKGRVASLLEVGTGFHGELTGRENIYLNGSILGMSKVEIKKKFDEIIAFAEVEKFLDTPVKRYSSGMYVRLAFAVAAHLDPEILIVDEVLAVGDTEFQKKCLGKMQEVSKESRTVIFVSHNMSIIKSLCPRALLMDRGELVRDSSSEYAVQLYLEKGSDCSLFIGEKRAKNQKHTLTKAKLSFLSEESQIYPNPSLRIDSEIFSTQSGNISFNIRLLEHTGFPVGFASLGSFNTDKLIKVELGLNELSVVLPINQLAVGKYSISIDLTLPYVEYYDRVEECLSFEVTRSPEQGDSDVLSQAWGAGSIQLPLELVEINS